MDSEIDELVQAAKVSADDAAVLAEALERSRGVDQTILNDVVARRRRRRRQTLTAAVSFLCIGMLCGYWLVQFEVRRNLRRVAELNSTPLISDENVNALSASIGALEERLHRPGRAADYQKLALLYGARFAQTHDARDQQKGEDAFRRARELEKKQLGDVLMNRSSGLRVALERPSLRTSLIGNSR